MESEKIMWGIHMPVEMENLALSDKPEVAITWSELGDLSAFGSQEALKKKYREIYSEATFQSVSTNAGQLYHFSKEIKIGDYVLFPSKIQHKIYIGEVTGAYHFDANDKQHPNKIPVKWICSIPRTSFSQGALYESGSFLTVFKIRKYKDEFLKAAGICSYSSEKEPDKTGFEDETVAATADDIERSTRDFVLKELGRIYKGYPLQGVVKDLLEAMGYNAETGPEGTDGGIDLIAYKDEFPPRIVVQVKSYETNSVGIADIKNLVATLQPGDVGIFVTLGDYSPDAKEFLDSKPNIKALTGYEFVRLILRYYDDMPNDFQVKIPLKRVYIPIKNEK
jgi:restriction system protein